MIQTSFLSRLAYAPSTKIKNEIKKINKNKNKNKKSLQKTNIGYSFQYKITQRERDIYEFHLFYLPPHL